jgi:hypothetical protein
MMLYISLMHIYGYCPWRDADPIIMTLPHGHHLIFVDILHHSRLESVLRPHPSTESRYVIPHTSGP